MKIGPDCKVEMHYSLSLDDGEELENTQEEGPIEFTCGEGKIIPGLEKELQGLAEGDEKLVVVPPEDAYGDYNPEALTTVPREEFPPEEKVEPGMTFVARREDGMIMHITVLEAGETEVKLDLNHPLAGKTLHFNVKILKITPPVQQ